MKCLPQCINVASSVSLSLSLVFGAAKLKSAECLADAYRDEFDDLYKSAKLMLQPGMKRIMNRNDATKCYPSLLL